ncbi:GNAT family N-acetyltransferase [Rhizobium oryzicola]|uniref:GNAT family N-acetyltransferase n=1 Tax=Rhizobium oryzicola TaxID=1232668 RepID=A0ABT8T120_9HYPH|nr:GNAT family N-acetyltransferase [Rhizobium oryzicola]MDO1584326.1 GNAT family N-acetyltransferase [Rhizobium oryzicola]
MTFIIRPARAEDAPAMAYLINEIIQHGGTTAHKSLFDTDRIMSDFIRPHAAISCFVAVADERVVGFQALEWADPNWPGEDKKIPADWGIIATYVHRSCQGTGVGRTLFKHTEVAAKSAGVTSIDATIRKENAGGLRYYSSLGFQNYREGSETISKQFLVRQALPA